MMSNSHDSPDSKVSSMKETRIGSDRALRYLLGESCVVSGPTEQRLSEAESNASDKPRHPLDNTNQPWQPVFSPFSSSTPKTERKRVTTPPSVFDTKPKKSCSDVSATASSLFGAHTTGDSWSQMDSYPIKEAHAGQQDQLRPEEIEAMGVAGRTRNDVEDCFGMSHADYLAGTHQDQLDDGDLADMKFTEILFPDPLPPYYDHTQAQAVAKSDNGQPDDDSCPNRQQNLDAPSMEQHLIPRAKTILQVSIANPSTPAGLINGFTTPRFSPSNSTQRIYISQYSVTNADVLCGRELSGSDHPGNLAYLSLVAKHKQRHSSFGSQHSEKTKIRNYIVDQVIDGGGRFVGRTFDGRHYLLTKEEARYKVSQCLREKKKKNSRKRA